MEAVGDAEARHAADDVVHHIARTGHHEAHVRHPFEHLGGRLDEVVGPLLIGDAPQEGDDLVPDAAFGGGALRLGEPHGVVHRHHLFGRNAVAGDDDVAREVRHGDHTVGGLHARAFDGIGLRIDVLAAAVELRGVHVHDQRFSGDPFGGDSGEVGEPVVGVDHVELPRQIAGHLRGYHRIARHLLHEVRAVFARKGVALLPEVGRLPRLASRADVLVVIGLVLFGRDVGDHVRVDMDERHLLPQLLRIAGGAAEERLHVAGVDHAHIVLVFVSGGTGHDEGHVDIVSRQPARHAVAGRTQTACDMRGKFPSEH